MRPKTALQTLLLASPPTRRFTQKLPSTARMSIDFGQDDFSDAALEEGKSREEKCFNLLENIQNGNELNAYSVLDQASMVLMPTKKMKEDGYVYTDLLPPGYDPAERAALHRLADVFDNPKEAEEVLENVTDEQFDTLMLFIEAGGGTEELLNLTDEEYEEILQNVSDIEAEERLQNVEKVTYEEQDEEQDPLGLSLKPQPQEEEQDEYVYEFETEAEMAMAERELANMQILSDVQHRPPTGGALSHPTSLAWLSIYRKRVRQEIPDGPREIDDSETDEDLEVKRRLQALSDKWKKLEEKEEINEYRSFGLTKPAEVINGRLAMFFIGTGLITEYYTGESIPQQVGTAFDYLR
jgi:hypothetical protein